MPPILEARELAKSYPLGETVVDALRGVSLTVDLPEPDGPMSATNSPSSTVRDTPRSASTTVSPRG